MNAPEENIKEWTDEWGVVWRRLGNDIRGQAKEFPIKEVERF